MSIEARLAELGVTLPDAPAPAANYVPFVITGNLCHVSGQISADANGQIKGKLGADFTDQPKVINGASDFMVAVLGDAGRHARSAVSAASLPFGVAVEIEAIFEIA